MVDIPEHLLQRSAEARAKALGISIEQAIAEMKGQSDPTVISKEPEVKIIDETPPPAAETPAKPADAPPPPAKTITPLKEEHSTCLLYTSPSPRDLSTSRMPSSA